MQNGKDPQLWEIAKRRASFKYHVGTYVIVISFFWVIWFIHGGEYGYNDYPWPVWPMMGWGIGLLFHFLGAYVLPKEGSAEREYERMTRNKSEQNFH